jgi:hypothetical protein
MHHGFLQNCDVMRSVSIRIWDHHIQMSLESYFSFTVPEAHWLSFTIRGDKIKETVLQLQLERGHLHT